MSTSEDGWQPIEQWTPEHGDEVEGYWQYRDQAGRLTEGWSHIERVGEQWMADGMYVNKGLYTHFRPLTRPRDVTPLPELPD